MWAIKNCIAMYCHSSLSSEDRPQSLFWFAPQEHITAKLNQGSKYSRFKVNEMWRTDIASIRPRRDFKSIRLVSQERCHWMMKGRRRTCVRLGLNRCPCQGRDVTASASNSDNFGPRRLLYSLKLLLEICLRLLSASNYFQPQKLLSWADATNFGLVNQSLKLPRFQTVSCS